MNTASHSDNSSFLCAFGRLIEKERETLKFFLSESEAASDPDLQSIFRKMAADRQQTIALLESHYSEIRSQEEITRQINAMFQ